MYAHGLLQKIDLSSAADLYLCKTLARTKSISSTQALPSSITSKAEASNPFQEPAYANVTARLYNSTPVRTAIDEFLGLIREILGVPDLKDVSRAKKRLRKSDYNASLTPKTTAVPTENEDTEKNRIHKEDSGTIKYSVEDGSDDDDEYKQYESRLADDSPLDRGLSDEDDRLETEVDTRATALDTIPMDEKATIEELYQDPEQDSASSTSSHESRQPRRIRAPSAKSSLTSKPATTFLPSLMMGGYISGSESASDISNEEGAAPRKNRRGQKARRAIWEKKYRENANHIKKQRQSRDYGWDARRGALPNDGSESFRGKRRKEYGDGHRDRPRASGANIGPVKPRDTSQKSENAKLHPSWEAARRMKEQRKTPAFEGKKIVFD